MRGEVPVIPAVLDVAVVETPQARQQQLIAWLQAMHAQGLSTQAIATRS